MAELADLPAGRQARWIQEETMPWFVYCISSVRRNYIYAGLTNALWRRVSQHNEGRERTTRTYSPFKLIHYEEFETRIEARIREKYLKSGIGKEFLRKISKESHAVISE